MKMYREYYWRNNWADQKFKVFGSHSDRENDSRKFFTKKVAQFTINLFLLIFFYNFNLKHQCSWIKCLSYGGRLEDFPLKQHFSILFDPELIYYQGGIKELLKFRV